MQVLEYQQPELVVALAQQVLLQPEQVLVEEQVLQASQLVFLLLF